MEELCGNCHSPLGAFRLTLGVSIVWGDGRPDYSGDKGAFCSFSCGGAWLLERGAEHQSPAPPDPSPSDVVVDETTTTLIR